MKNFKLFLENAKEAKNNISSLGVYKVLRKKSDINPEIRDGRKQLEDPVTGMTPKDFKDNEDRHKKDGKKDDK